MAFNGPKPITQLNIKRDENYAKIKESYEIVTAVNSNYYQRIQ